MSIPLGEQPLGEQGVESFLNPVTPAPSGMAAFGVVTHPPGTITVTLTIPPDIGEDPELVAGFLGGVIPEAWMIEIRSH